MSRLGDIAAVAISVVGLIVLTAWSAAEISYEQGKRDQLAAFACQVNGGPGFAYMRVNRISGEVACFAPFVREHDKVERARAANGRARMAKVEGKK